MTTEGDDVQANVRQYLPASAKFTFRLLSSSVMRILSEAPTKILSFHHLMQEFRVLVKI